MIGGTTSTAILNDPGKEIMEDFLVILYLYLYINVSSIYHSVLTHINFLYERNINS